MSASPAEEMHDGLAHLVGPWVSGAPDRVAVTTETESLTFAELAQLMDFVADQLGSGHGLIGLDSTDELLCAAALFASARSGPRNRAMAFDGTSGVDSFDYRLTRSGIRKGLEGRSSRGWVSEFPAFVVSTSGVGGSPRHVAHTAASLTRSLGALAARHETAKGDAWVSTHRLDTIGGIVLLLRTLSEGNTLHLRTRPHPIGLLEEVRETRSAGLATDPFRLRILTRAASATSAALPDLVVVGSGSMLLTADIAENAERVLGAAVVDSYGSTELAGPVLIRSHPEASFGLLPDVETRIDKDELLVRTSASDVCYVDQTGRLNGVTQDPDGWFRTGDQAAYDTLGRVVLKGRQQRSLVVGGRVIDTEAVEAALDETHGVRRVAIVSEQRRGRDRLACRYELDDTHDVVIVEDVLQSSLRDLGFRGVELFQDESIRLTRNGKIDRQALES
jgi:acyl-coenzyme A synthetase/AMP-(fatty) acid ligase